MKQGMWGNKKWQAKTSNQKMNILDMCISKPTLLYEIIKLGL